MPDQFKGPFGGYANVTEVVSALAQTAILAEIDKLAALFPASPNAGGQGVQMPHPDFDQIPPHTAEKIRAEIAALKAAIDAAPTA